MSNELNNKIVVSILIVAIIVSIGGTTAVLYKMNQITEITGSKITGQATGEVKIDISDLLAIDIDPENSEINFGSCDPSGIPTGGNASISSEMTEAEINSTTDLSCSDSNLHNEVDGTYIGILNVGNVEAVVTMTSTQTGSGLLNAEGSQFFYRTVSPSVGGGCTGTQDEYTEITNTGADYDVCGELSSGDDNAVWLYTNLTIPKNADTGSSENTAVLEFTAGSISPT